MTALQWPLSLFRCQLSSRDNDKKMRRAKTNLATKCQKTTREPQQVLTFLRYDGVDGSFTHDI